MDEIQDILQNISEKGVKLWSAEGRLCYSAPKGALTQKDVESLKAVRHQLIERLRREPVHAPLSYSQLAHWNLYQLARKRSVRHVASATRINGPLNAEAFKRSVKEVVLRHDSLRTRIVHSNGVPAQVVGESSDCELVFDDLSSLPESERETAIRGRLEAVVLKSIDVSRGPLFALHVLTLSPDEHVLLMAMEHMISDGFSRNILLRDIFTGYAQALKAKEISLPAILVNFTDYAKSQRSTEDSWVEKHGGYWRERLKGIGRLRFPDDMGPSDLPYSGWGITPIRIDPELTAELREWARLRQTTAVLSLFSAYAAFVLRWCEASDAVFPYQTDGRSNSRLQNTVGYFAAPLYLRVRLFAKDDFVSFLNRVVQEYCTAHEHADHCYLEAQEPRADFTRNSCFNCLPQGAPAGLLDLDRSEIALTPITFEHPQLKVLDRDTEPVVVFFDAEHEMSGEIYFARNRFSVKLMERFAAGLLMFVRTMVKSPNLSVKNIPLNP
jgi:hypothetical protein